VSEGIEGSPLSTISGPEIARRALAFSGRFSEETSESAESQTWWNALFDVFGQDRYKVALFQRAARRSSTSNTGLIDVFMPGVFIGEHKSFGKSLDDAEAQAEDYLLGGGIPPSEEPNYIVTTDFREIRISNLQAPLEDPIRFHVKDLAKNYRQLEFLAGYSPQASLDEHQVSVTIKAARLLGELQSQLTDDLTRGDEDEEDSLDVAILMSRLLFLMFGDDTLGLWESRAFLRVVTELSSDEDPNIGPLLSLAFQTLDTPPASRSNKLDDRLLALPYVNGGLFSSHVRIPVFDEEMRQTLIRAMSHDWAGVSLSILGNLFQGSSTRQARREHGEHYTSEEFILRLLRPLFLDDFYLSLKTAWGSKHQLEKLWDRIASAIYFDPACGSGNFLIVAYRELRRLELKIAIRLRQLKDSSEYSLDGTGELRVSQSQFFGIEVKWWPLKLAEAAMFLVDHQCNLEMQEALGHAPNRLPISEQMNLHHGDALSSRWEDFLTTGRETFIFGNPPFHGTKERKESETAGLKQAWGNAYSGNLDYVTGWFAKSASFLKHDVRGRFAFVATNSISQGQSVSLLFPPLLDGGWRIRFAHQTFAWESDAAGKAQVHVVIIGFDKLKGSARLFSYDRKFKLVSEKAAKQINGYLLDGEHIYVLSNSQGPISKEMRDVDSGSSPIDFKQLLLDVEGYEQAAMDPIASKYLRKFLNGNDFIEGKYRWCLWLEELSRDELRSSRFLQERMEILRTKRSASDRAVTKQLASTPHLFGEVRQPKEKFLAFPQTFTLNRPYLTVGYLGPENIVGQKIYTCIDPNGLQFAIASSGLFLHWQLLVGGRLKSDPSFSIQLVWNNYPLPELSEQQRTGLIIHGVDILEARAHHPNLNLAQLYDETFMPSDLKQAHARLDRATLKIFGIPPESTVDEVQNFLLGRYKKLSR
jgi:hypothetical protein